MTHSNIQANFATGRPDMKQNPMETIPVVLGLLTFIGGCLAALMRWFTKLQQVESHVQDLRTDLAHHRGKVETLEISVNAINSRLTAIETKLDIILSEKRLG